VTDPTDRDESERDETAPAETPAETTAEENAGEAGAESAAAEEAATADQPSASEGESPKEAVTGDGESSDDAATGNDESASEDPPPEGEAASDDDDLPEWEPLTPELVEDEAIRGDFMLRWAVILLALLLGCREISETASLVHIKTGQYLASNGFLPPGNDVFSYTANERPWVNTGWLFDLIVGGVYGVGGAVGLSLLTAVIAAATLYFVVHISRDELPTWWTAFCAGLALFILQVEFTALPEIVTLLGAAWLIRGLVHWSQTGDRRTLWCVAGSLAVWGNLDPRAFVGWILLVAYALGTVIGDALGRRNRHESACAKDLGLAVAAGTIALMVNPFGWQTLLAPISYYTVQLPALIEYRGHSDLLVYPLFESRLWQPFSLIIVIGIGLPGVALLTSIANFTRLDFGLLFSCLAISGLAIACTHELAAAALVATVLAGLNGQDWYRANCRVEYSIGTLEVLWSRAGRALTVLALAGFAWLAVSGRLMGPNGKRIGVGFSPQLATNISGFERDLEDVGDDRMFVFRLEQGDLLVWLDRPTFVDSRVGVYAGGEEDILLLHNKARHALRSFNPASVDRSASTDDAPAAVGDSEAAPGKVDPKSWFGRRELWVDTFDRFDVQIAIPRLWGLKPDAQTWVDLENSPDWTQVSLGATSAFFARTTAPLPVGDEPVPEGQPLRVDFAQKAFRDCSTPAVDVERIDWPRPRTAYQNFLSLPANLSSADLLRARRHADWLVLGGNGAVQVTSAEALALAILVMRNATAALDNDVNNIEAFQLQASASQTIGQLEASVMAAAGGVDLNQQRHIQKMHALHQALMLDPNSIDLTATIAEEYFQRQRWDLALEMIDRTLDQIRSLENPNEQALTVAQQLTQVKRELDPRIEAMAEQLAQTLSGAEPDIAGLIMTLAQQGYPRKALELYDEHRLTLGRDMVLELQGAFLYAECGQLEDAEAAFAAFESLPDSPLVSDQWVLQSAWLKMAKGEHEKAIALCQRRLNDVERSTANALLGFSSLLQPVPGYLADQQLWPYTLTAASSRALYDARDETTRLRWTIAMTMIEAGFCSDATAVLQQLLEADPETQIRPLVALYLRLLTGELIPEFPESEVVPILIQDGPEDPVDEAGKDDAEPENVQDAKP
jgi:tetratricopeptide (TPR) repeat protein